jgi:hypothetical protein
MSDHPTTSPAVCPHCQCPDLYVRKDFPQRLGLAFVALAAVAFLILAESRARFWIGITILLTAMAIDAIVYLFVGRVVVCYRCGVRLKEIPPDRSSGPFDLSTAEKYRKPAGSGY